jgi:hypothetical protein
VKRWQREDEVVDDITCLVVFVDRRQALVPSATLGQLSPTRPMSPEASASAPLMPPQPSTFADGTTINPVIEAISRSKEAVAREPASIPNPR